MSTVKVGLVGVGNNASAMVQGVHYYAQQGDPEALSGTDGIRFGRLCGLGVGDIEFTSAFDVDDRKVGLDLSEAISVAPNCYPHVIDVPFLGIEVTRGPRLDGVPAALEKWFEVGVGNSVDENPLESEIERVAEILRTSDTEVLVNFLPSGASDAARFYAAAAIRAKVAYINCTPCPIVYGPECEMFAAAGVPLLGDDLESQFGSSLIHRTLLTALAERGLTLKHSYQVNLGGNADFANLTARPDAKKASKMRALSTAASSLVDILPSGGVLPGLGDNKVGYFAVEGRGWLGMPVQLDVKLRVQDSSNAAGVVIDLIRLAKGALVHGHEGYLPLSFYFKSPLGTKLSTTEALAVVEELDRSYDVRDVRG